jgi:hypothetical protein
LAKIPRDFLETAGSLLPVTLVVLLLQAALGFLDAEGLARYLGGTILSTAGLLLFLRGVNISLLPLGELVGGQLPRVSSLWLLLCLAFIVGASANAADPSLQILAQHMKTTAGEVSPALLLLVVVAGIGVFVSLALLRIALGLHPALLLGLGYGLVLALSLVVPEAAVPIALDAGGVATGPLTVPFLISLGLGFVSVLGGRNTSSDGFGLLGLAALGPVLGVMLLGTVLG